MGFKWNGLMNRDWASFNFADVVVVRTAMLADSIAHDSK